MSKIKKAEIIEENEIPTEMTLEEKVNEINRMKRELGLYADDNMLINPDPHAINSQYKHYCNLFETNPNYR